jgi:hypothetical protein
MGVIIPQVLTEDRVSGAQIVDGTLRFDSSKSQYLNRTPSSASNRKTWTWSGWVKRGTLTSSTYSLFAVYADGSNRGYISYQGSTDKILLFSRVGGSDIYEYSTSAVFRDASAWYNVVVAFDTTQATASNRLKIYVNNVEQSLTASTTVSQNVDTYFNTTQPHHIGYQGGGDAYFSGYLNGIYLIDGQALDPSYFGYTDPLTNVWRPKKFKPQATPNDGTVWSTATVSAGTIDESYPVSNAFNGSLSGNNMRSSGANTTITLTLPKSISFSNQIRIYHNQNGTANINNESTVNTSSGGANWVTVYTGSGNFSSLTLTSTGGDTVSLFAVEVDGVVLIDGDTSNIGLNGFYLPFDGSAPIGQDQSGRGNNWTPVNFGGSNTIEKATGALPILNTDGGGKVARVGVRTDSSASSLVLALPLVGIKSDFSNKVNGGTTEKAITATNAVASYIQSNFYGGSFAFDGNGDYLSSPNSTDYAFGTGDFTVETWVYLNSTGANQIFVGNWTSGTGWQLYFTSSTTKFAWYVNSGILLSSTTTPATGRWYHISVSRTGTTLRMFVNGVLDNSTTDSTNYSTTQTVEIGYQQSTSTNYLNGYLQDIRVYKGAAKYTSNFIPASTDPDIVPDSPSGVSYSSNVALVPSTDGAVAFDGSGDYLSIADSVDFDVAAGDFTLEGYIYPQKLASYNIIFDDLDDNRSGIQLSITSSGLYDISVGDGAGNWIFQNNSTASVIGNAWQHIAITRSGSSFRFFLNGVQQLSTTSSTAVGNPKAVTIGGWSSGSDYYFQGFISNFHFVKGTALYTSNFTPPSAPISSVENTKLLCCKSQSSATAADVTPGTITANGNAAASNFNPFTVNINTQRGKQSGYATWNPISVYLQSGSTTSTLSNGNLNIAFLSGTNAANQYYSTIAVNNGKWYCEWTDNSSSPSSNSQAFILGVQNLEYPRNFLSETGGYGISNGSVRQLWLNGVNTNSWWSGTPSQGDVYGIALDCDNSTISFYRNGISLGSSQSIPTNKTYAFAITPYQWQATSTGSANFGQKPFKFPPPAGFQPLTLANTPRPTIVRPDQFVGVTTYTGNGTNGRVINVGFTPDLVWVKGRENMSDGFPYDHNLYDSVRGAGKNLRSNSTGAENTNDQYGYLSSFVRNGFTVTGGSTDDYYVNDNGKNFVAWTWKAGGNSNTFNINDVGYETASAAGLTAGTITPTGASVNTKSGFSIVSWTGNGDAASIAHGLGVEPHLIIHKFRGGTSNWSVYTKVTGAGGRLKLNTTDAFSSDGTFPTTPTSSLFYVNAGSNDNGVSMIAYCWSEIPGFSKFGSYTGNGSSDGSFVFTGMRVRWIMIKNSSDATSWVILDTARDTYNPEVSRLLANSSNAEATGINVIDGLSNGFKLRDADAAWNASGNTYIYAAFAETPTFNLYGSQSNAR